MFAPCASRASRSLATNAEACHTSARLPCDFRWFETGPHSEFCDTHARRAVGRGRTAGVRADERQGARSQWPRESPSVALFLDDEVGYVRVHT
jgi:hypothetical protein